MCVNPEVLQVVLDPPTERHAAAHVPVLWDVVLYKNRSCLRSVRHTCGWCLMEKKCGEKKEFVKG